MAEAQAEPIIKVEKVWKEYGESVVLERLHLDVNKGEFCTIVGASGCGKTTFLRMLLGEEVPSRGKVFLEGSPLPDEPTHDRGIVFQRYSVFPHLTVLDNVMLGLEFEQSKFLGKLFGKAKQKIRNDARQMIAAVGLADSINKLPSALSGGMQQRLAIAQSLIKKPKILLLDEPFGALDPGIRADMHQLILSLWNQTQTTIFMVTHDLQEGFYLGTRLLVFDKVRHDPQSPDRYGATITYDIPLGVTDEAILAEIKRTTRLEHNQSEQPIVLPIL